MNQKLAPGAEKVTEFDCNFMVRQFDTTRSGFLVYEDFRYLILPREMIKGKMNAEMKAKKTAPHIFLSDELED